MRTLAVVLSLLLPLSAAAGFKRVSRSIAAQVSSASSGDTIEIAAGTYSECLKLTQSGVTLQGAGRDQTRIECDTNALRIEGARNVTVRGITFVKTGSNENSTVFVDGGGVTFRQNRVRSEGTGGLTGLEIEGGGGSYVIEDNEFENSVTNGIWVYGSGSATIARNRVANSGNAGIRVKEIASATIEANRVDGTGSAGIYIFDCPARVVRNDVRRAKYAGVEVEGSRSSGVIEDNYLAENLESGVYINEASSPRVERNVMWKNGMHGVAAKKGARPTVLENTIAGCGQVGLFAYADAVMTARRNIVVGCKWGISLDPPEGTAVGTMVHSDNVVYRSTTTNFDKIAQDPSEKVLDPAFVNEAGGDFHLSPRSPLYSMPIRYGAYAAVAPAQEAPPPQAPPPVQRRTEPPPNLEVSAAFDDSAGNGDRTLDAGERAALVLKIKNAGRGPGLDVKVQAALKFEMAAITVGQADPPGRIDPGDLRVVQISIAGGEELAAAEAELAVTVSERDGFDAEPLAVRFRTRARAAPSLALLRYSIRDAEGARSSGNGNGRIEKGEMVEVTATIINRGQGAAEGVKVALSSSSNDVLITSAAADLGTLAPGAWKEASISFSVNRRYAGSALLPLSLAATESRSRGNLSEPLELTLDSSAPQGRTLTVDAPQPGVSPAPAATASPRKPLIALREGEARPTLVVTDLTTGAKKFDEDLVSALSDRVRGVIVRTGFFRVVSRDQMDAILKEQKFAKSEACDEAACMVEMGKALGARYMASGKLSKIGKTMTLTLQLVDVEKILAVNSISRDCKACQEEDLLGVADSTAADLVSAR